MLTKSEIEVAIKDKDDFVKISYLNRFLKQADSMEMKKFILLSLAAINESKGLISDTIKNVTGAADVSITFREKKELYIKEVFLWIKIGEYNVAEKAFNKALSYTSESEKNSLRSLYEDSFKAIAKSYENQGKNRKATEVYDKLYSITKNPVLKLETKQNLMNLYWKTGNIREYNRLKGSS